MLQEAPDEKSDSLGALGGFLLKGPRVSINKFI